MRSIYHIREYCVRKLSLVCIFHIHEWYFKVIPQSYHRSTYSYLMIGLNLLNSMATFLIFSIARAFSARISTLALLGPHRFWACLELWNLSGGLLLICTRGMKLGLSMKAGPSLKKFLLKIQMNAHRMLNLGGTYYPLLETRFPIRTRLLWVMKKPS